MKTHHYIFLTAALFVLVFYDQDLGMNLGILSIIYALLTFFKTPERNRNKPFLILFVTSILSGFAFIWYGDFPSLIAVVSSILLLGYRSRNKKLKILFLIPVFIINSFTSLFRFFSFDEWLPKKNVSGVWQKTLAFIIIPLLLISIFFGIYSAGSDHFAAVFRDYELDINVWQVLCLSVLGFSLRSITGTTQ